MQTEDESLDVELWEGTYLWLVVDAEVDKGTFGQGFKDLRVILAMEAVAVGHLVEVQVVVLDIAMSSITRHGSLIIATPVRDLATTAAVAWPFTIALQELVSARILHPEGSCHGSAPHWHQESR